MPEKATPLLLVYGGTSLDGLLYRATADCPPTLDDFRSHESLGLPYPQALFIRATDISVYRTRRQLERSRVRFDLGPATAAVELRTAGVAWAEPEPGVKAPAGPHARLQPGVQRHRHAPGSTRDARLKPGVGRYAPCLASEPGVRAHDADAISIVFDDGSDEPAGDALLPHAN